MELIDMHQHAKHNILDWILIYFYELVDEMAK